MEIKPLKADDRVPTRGAHIVQEGFKERISTNLLDLNAEASNHLANALRYRENDLVSITDGQGHLAQTRIKKISKNLVTVAIQDWWFQEKHQHSLTIMQGIPKGKKLDDVIRAASELGVERFCPLQTLRCDRQLSGDKATKQVKRWRDIAKAACEQSRQTYVMDIAEIGSIPQNIKGIVLWEETDMPLTDALNQRQGSDLTFLIGPEGGLTPEEVEQSQMARASLGSTILRTETAGIVAATLGAYHLGRLT